MTALFDGLKVNRRRLTLNNCEPELFTKVGEPRHAAFNGELKSGGVEDSMIAKVVTYVCAGMIHSFFGGYERGSGAKVAFYYQPPVGYGLLGFAHLGYFVAVEWIGKLLVSPISKSFFISSEDHKIATESLTDVVYDEPLVLDTGAFAVCKTLGVKVVWTQSAINGCFFKIISCDAYPGDYFVNLFRVYKKYTAVFNDDAEKHHLVFAQLMYGEFEVAVKMQFMEGTENPTDKQMEAPEVVESVAKGIVWLARHGMIYRDLRTDNVLIKRRSENITGVWLIDYDDIVIIEESITDYASFVAKLAEVCFDGCNYSVEVDNRNLLVTEMQTEFSRYKK